MLRRKKAARAGLLSLILCVSMLASLTLPPPACAVADYETLPGEFGDPSVIIDEDPGADKAPGGDEVLSEAENPGGDVIDEAETPGGDVIDEAETPGGDENTSGDETLSGGEGQDEVPGPGEETDPGEELAPGEPTAVELVQAMIDALPDPETVSGEDEALRDQLEAAWAAYNALTEEEQALVDATRLNELRQADFGILKALRETEAPWAGDGTAEAPYLIADAGDLVSLADLVYADETADGYRGKYFQMTANIELSGEWKPIGTQEKPFKGIFDGGNKIVSGLKIGSGASPSEHGYQGLFGFNSGAIQNLTVTGSVYSAGDYVGGIAGYSDGAVVNCTFGSKETADVVEGKDYVGGIAGYAAATGYSSAQRNASLANYGAVSGGQHVGGIFGAYNGYFGPYFNDGQIYTIVNYGDVGGAGDVGGVLGRLSGTYYGLFCSVNGSITNYGAVTGSLENTGGVVGYMEGYFRGEGSSADYNFNGAVKNAGRVTGAGAVGGVVGRSYGDLYDTNNYYGTEAAILNEVEGLGPGEAGVSGQQYVGGIVGYCGGSIIPYYRYENSSDVAAAGDYAGGIAGYINGGVSVYGYQMINTGDIRGAGFVGGITGYTKTYISHSRGTISNSGTVAGSGDNVGGIAGLTGTSLWAGDDTLENTGAVSGVNNVGGITGQTGTYVRMGGDGTFRNTGPVAGSGDNVGGIAGLTGTYFEHDSAGVLKNTGSVTGVNNVGGIVGLGKGDVARTWTGPLESSGAVTATGNNAGGIAGQLAGSGLVADSISAMGASVTGACYAGGIVGLTSGSVTISNSYNTIEPVATGPGSVRGALAGGIGGGTDTLTITGCYSYVTDGPDVVDLPLVGAAAATVTASYILVADTYTGTDPAAKKAEDFRYGSLAYELDKGGTETRSNIWGQKLGADPAPVFVSEEHPAVYKIGVTQNAALGISVKPVAPAGAIWKDYDTHTYVNKGTVINLTATGLDAADDLAFLPIDTVYKDTEAGAPHGSYIVTGIERDIVITYEKEIKVGEDTGWYGTGEDESFAISSETELRGLAELVNSGTSFSGKTVTLGADIGLTATYWIPIGTQEHPFTGTFIAGGDADNGYFEISGLDMEVSSEAQGLFSYLENAAIENLTVRGAIKGGSKLGGIAGVSVTSAFENCVNGVALTGTDNVGGIAGFTTGSSFTGCVNSASVTGSGSGTGGIAGVATGSSFTGCANSAAVTGVDYVGGIAGNTVETATLTDCYNAGTVTGTGEATGGVAGYLDGAAQLTNCYNAAEGSVTGEANTGGVAGTLGNYAELTNCYNAGTVTGTGSYVGGVAGYLAGTATLTGCYNAGAVTGTGSRNSYVGGVAGYLAGTATLTGCYNAGAVTGTGSRNSYVGGVAGYAQTGSEDAMAVFVNCYNAAEGSVAGKADTGGVAGLSGYYSRFIDCYNAGGVTGNGANTGGVAGTLGDYAEPTNCYNAGTVTGTGEVTGGVAGTLGASAQPANCYNDGAGTVTGSGTYTGGVFGTLSAVATEVSGLYNAGTVTGSGTYTGGVFGYVAAGSKNYISFCYNMGTVTGSGGYAAGVAGYLFGSWSYPTGTVATYLHRCYNLGTVTGSGPNTLAAGITGLNTLVYAYAVDSFVYGTVTAATAGKVGAISAAGYRYNQNCYYLGGSLMTTVEGNPVLVEQPVDANYITAKTAAEFASGAVAYLLDRGDTADRTENWGQGERYPVPADAAHPALYRLTIELEGPAAGFTAPEPPAGEPAPPVNSVTLGAAAAAADTALVAFAAKGAAVTPGFTLKEGYLLDYVTATAADGTDCPVTVDDPGMAFAFTMPEDGNVAVVAAFAEVPANPDQLFTVTFNANGGEWPDGTTQKSEPVQAGRRAAIPEEPVYDAGLLAAMTFTGWYTDKTCATRYNFTATVKQNLTLYAGWRQAERYAVTFNGNGGSFTGGTTQTMIVNEGDVVTKPAVDPTRDGHTFRGWYTDQACLLLYDFTRPVSGGLTLYAGWAVAGTCVVIFDANGGTITKADGTAAAVVAVTVNSGGMVDEPAAAKAAHGSSTYELAGWLTEGGTAWNFANPVTESMTLTASWTEKSFTSPGEGGSYEIPDLATLEALRGSVNDGNTHAGDTFLLTADIELPAGWTSIGSYEILSGPQFLGTFDGGGHTITLHPYQTQALFGLVGSAGRIKNLRIEGDLSKGVSLRAGIYFAGIALSCQGAIDNCEVSAKLYGCNAGIAYYSVGGQFTGCTIRSGSVISGDTIVSGIVAIASSNASFYANGCTVEPGVSITGISSGGTSGVTGVAGILAYACGTIENCSNGADITASYEGGARSVGGIVGHTNSVSSVTIKNCFNTGDIHTDGGYAGGLAGAAGGRPVIIENSYNTGDVIATGTIGFVGGLVGSNASYSNISAKIANSYSIGNVIAVNATDYVGGLVGYSSGYSDGNIPSKIINSYWYGETISAPAGASTVGGIVGGFDTASSKPTEVEDCYYGVKAAADGTTAEITDPFDGNGATKLDGSAFPSGQAAYLLDGGDGPHQNVWTMGEYDFGESGAGVVKLPVLGIPSVYCLEYSIEDGVSGAVYLTSNQSFTIQIEREDKVVQEGDKIIKTIYTPVIVTDNCTVSRDQAALSGNGNGSVSVTYKVEIREETVKPEPEPEPEPELPSDDTGTGDGPDRGGGTGGTGDNAGGTVPGGSDTTGPGPSTQPDSGLDQAPPPVPQPQLEIPEQAETKEPQDLEVPEEPVPSEVTESTPEEDLRVDTEVEGVSQQNNLPVILLIGGVVVLAAAILTTGRIRQKKAGNKTNSLR